MVSGLRTLRVHLFNAFGAAGLAFFVRGAPRKAQPALDEARAAR